MISCVQQYGDPEVPLMSVARCVVEIKHPGATWSSFESTRFGCSMNYSRLSLHGGQWTFSE